MQNNYQVWWDEKNLIVRAQHSGVCDEAQAKGMGEQVSSLLKKHETQNNGFLVDISQVEKYTPEALRILSEVVASLENTKMAHIGARTELLADTRFIWGAAGKPDMLQYFDTDGEALEWLKYGNQSS